MIYIEQTTRPNAEVLSVLPNKVTIAVSDLDKFNLPGEKIKVGSYLRIVDGENAVMIAIIENFSVVQSDDPTVPMGRSYVFEAIPLGIIRNGIFERGGDSLAIPPKGVTVATFDNINTIYAESIPERERFCFSTLSADQNIVVPVNGNFSDRISITTGILPITIIICMITMR